MGALSALPAAMRHGLGLPTTTVLAADVELGSTKISALKPKIDLRIETRQSAKLLKKGFPQKSKVFSVLPGSGILCSLRTVFPVAKYSLRCICKNRGTFGALNLYRVGA